MIAKATASGVSKKNASDPATDHQSSVSCDLAQSIGEASHSIVGQFMILGCFMMSVYAAASNNSTTSVQTIIAGALSICA